MTSETDGFSVAGEMWTVIQHMSHCPAGHSKYVQCHFAGCHVLVSKRRVIFCQPYILVYLSREILDIYFLS